MSTIQVPYLGVPGAMVALPSPNSAMAATPSLGDATTTSLSGSTTTYTRLHTKRSFSLPYDHLDPDSADLLLGFYNKLYGYGPFAFVDPSPRNVLGLDVSTVGLRTNAALMWVPSAGTLAVATSGGPPGLQTGVLTWSSLVAAATLQPGAVANTANTSAAPVYLPAEACTVSLYAKASTATTATLQLTGYSTAGVVNYTSSSTSMAVTTGWQRFTVSVAAGLAGLASSALVLPRIVLGGTVPTSISIAAAQLEYATAASGWQPGFGSPRVVITSSPGRDVPQIGYTDHTLTLAE